MDSGARLSLRPRNHVVHHRRRDVVEVVGFQVGVNALGYQRIEHRLQRRVGHRCKNVDCRPQRSYRRNNFLACINCTRVTRGDDGDVLSVDGLGKKRCGWRAPIEQCGREFIGQVLHVVEVEVRDLPELCSTRKMRRRRGQAAQPGAIGIRTMSRRRSSLRHHGEPRTGRRFPCHWPSRTLRLPSRRPQTRGCQPSCRTFLISHD